VLRGAYKFDRATIATALHRLIAIDGVHVEDEATTRLAPAAFEAGSADFADYVILESARRSGALPLHTFDERLSSADGAKRVDWKPWMHRRLPDGVRRMSPRSCPYSALYFLEPRPVVVAIAHAR
jgi:hypothetical protein